MGWLGWLGGDWITLIVSVACRGFHNGEDEMEYCRIRIVGKISKNLSNDISISGYSSNKSRIDILFEINSSVVRFCRDSSVSGFFVDEVRMRISRFVAGRPSSMYPLRRVNMVMGLLMGRELGPEELIVIWVSGNVRICGTLC